jgi:ATP-binding cassette, subfamily F, member 3
LSLLTVNQVSKAYFGRVVLDQVSLRLDRGERLALIGDNGAGKTTLLRLITAAEKPDSGSIILPSSVIPGYLSQHFEDADTLADTPLVSRELSDLENQLRLLENQIAAAGSDQRELLGRYSRQTARYETLGGYEFARRMQEILAGLGLAGDILKRPMATLSGGERMRVALARLLLKAPDLLLLDEPTNHMDLAAMEWLEDFLIRFKGAVLLISHDRVFIDRTATAVAELRDGRLDCRPGNYTHFREIQAAAELSRNREIRKVARELDRQREVTQTMLSHRKMSAYHAREKVVARLSGQLNDIRERACRQNQRLSFSFLPGQIEGDPQKILLSAQDLTYGYDGRPLFRNVSLMLRNGMKTCLCGPNGCGKSTLLALLLGRIDHFEGQVRLADQVVYGHMGQHVDFPDESRTLLEEILNRQDLGEGQARTLLARYGFRDVDVFKAIEVLSGGERSRLYLACLLLERPDILFLDEPTNHLDIHSREILEQALVDFPGAILSVSHDRYFIERCSRQVLGFIGDQVLPFMSFADYRQSAWQFEKQAAENHPDDDAARSTRPDPAVSRPAPGLNRTRERRETALRKEKTRETEKRISGLEAEKSALEAGFARATDASSYHRYTKVLAELDRLYETYIDLDQE